MSMNISAHEGGYSEPILQPCYLIGTSLIFLITPHIGLFWAFMLVAIPAFGLAKYIADRQPAVTYDHESYMKALDAFIEGKAPVPRLHDYEIKTPKVTGSQRRLQMPYLSKPFRSKRLPLSSIFYRPHLNTHK